MKIETLTMHDQDSLSALHQKFKNGGDIIIDGGFATGKSTAVNNIKKLFPNHNNVHIFNEDDVVGDSYHDPEVIKAISEYCTLNGLEFNDLVTDGHIDKKKITTFIRNKEHKDFIIDITKNYLIDQYNAFKVRYPNAIRLYDSPRYSDLFNNIPYLKPDSLLLLSADADIRIKRAQERHEQNNVEIYAALQAGQSLSDKNFDLKTATMKGHEKKYEALSKEDNFVLLETSDGYTQRNLVKALLGKSSDSNSTIS